MAFPIVSASAVSGALSGATQNIPLPTHAAGDRMIVVYALDGGTSNYVSNAGGWDVLANRTETQNAISLLVFEKIAASASESLSITLAATRNARSIAITVQGSDTTSAAEIALAGSDGTPTTSPNPPNLAPTYGAADTLWVAALAQDNSSVTLMSYPSGYDSNQLDNTGGTSATPRAALATRTANTATEDPGTFTLAANEQWVTATIAIKPAGGGSGVSGTISVTTAPAVASITGETGATGASGSIAVTTEPAGVTITGTAGSTSGNIRLSLGIQRERGGYAASMSSLKWCVFNADHTAVIASGTALATDASGVAVIDVNGTSYAPGDYVPVLVTDYNAATAAQDRVVRTFFGFVPAQAQP